MPILFELATGTPEPIYAQIVRQVRTGMATGSLAPAERLPSVRELARELVVNPNTVQKAYAELERHGTVLTRRGRGTFVSEHPGSALSRAEAGKTLGGLADRLLTEAVHLGFSEEEVLAELKKRARRYKFAARSGR